MRPIIAFLLLFTVLCSPECKAEPSQANTRALWIANAQMHVNAKTNPYYWVYLNGLSAGADEIQKGTFRAKPEAIYGKEWGISQIVEDTFVGIAAIDDPLGRKSTPETTEKFLADIIDSAGSPKSTLKILLNNEFSESSYERADRLRKEYSRLPIKFDEEAILGRIFDAAQSSPEFSAAVNSLLLPLFKARTTASFKEILASNIVLANLPVVKRILEGVSADPKISAQLRDEAIANVSEEMKDISSAGRIVAEHDPDKTKSEVWASDVSEIVEFVRKQNEGRAREKREQTVSEGLHASIYLIGRILPDENDSRRFTAWSTAALDLTNAARKFEASWTDAGGDDTGAAMSAAAMTASWVQIGLILFDSLGPSRPTGDQVILGQIQALSEQIREFQAETKKRFDQIDARLGVIHETISQGIDLLNTKAEISIEQVSQSRRSLALILNNLDALQSELSEYLELIATQPFNSAMGRCLGAEKKSGVKLKDDGYDECVNAIVQFVEESKSPVFSGDWDERRRETAPISFADDINLMLSYAAEAGYKFSKDERLANPVRWADAASSYLQLAIENDQIFGRRPLTQLDYILDEGMKLESTLATLAANSSEQSELWKLTIRDYINAARLVENAATPFVRTQIHGSMGRAIWLTKQEAEEFLLRDEQSFSNRPLLGEPRPTAEREDESLVAIFDLPKQAFKILRPGTPPDLPADGPERDSIAAVWRAADTLRLAESLGMGQAKIRYSISPGVVSVVPVIGRLHVAIGKPNVEFRGFLSQVGTEVLVQQADLFSQHSSVVGLTISNGPFAPPFPNCNSPGFRTGQQTAPLCRLVLHELTRLEVPSNLKEEDLFWDDLETPGNNAHGLTEEVNRRVDSDLIVRYRAITEEARKAGSDLHTAIQQLERTSERLRIVIGWSLPESALSDEIRALLFGRVDVQSCALPFSRTFGEFSADQHTATEQCIANKFEPVLSHFGLVTPEFIYSLLASPINNGAVEPARIGKSAFLLNLSEYAEANARELLRQINDLPNSGGSRINSEPGPSLASQINILRSSHHQMALSSPR
ncbi:hypothetical protein [Rhizobium leguminosarum]|uniref:hypothetical protein n=1 Tax=Rhizobium leguminosarum TaxID=384 RepID=UPI00103209A8|nr:hypothetical protein [Rhizobium leguminosarum]TBF89183.1 hypothetical protein ELG82_37190 [Rhizobium leguminosarum]